MRGSVDPEVFGGIQRESWGRSSPRVDASACRARRAAGEGRAGLRPAHPSPRRAAAIGRSVDPRCGYGFDGGGPEAGVTPHGDADSSGETRQEGNGEHAAAIRW